MSPVPHDVQTVVITRYCGGWPPRQRLVASGNPDSTGRRTTASRGPPGSALPRWTARGRGGIDIGTAVHGVSVVGRTSTRDEVESSWRRRAGPAGPLGWSTTRRRGTPRATTASYLRRVELADWTRPHRPRPGHVRHITIAVGRRGSCTPAGRNLGLNAGSRSARYHPHQSTPRRDDDWFGGLLVREARACGRALSESGRPRVAGETVCGRAMVGESWSRIGHMTRGRRSQRNGASRRRGTRHPSRRTRSCKHGQGGAGRREERDRVATGAPHGSGRADGRRGGRPATRHLDDTEPGE